MLFIQRAEQKAQTLQGRVMSIIKAISIVITTGTGAGVSVRAFLFTNWEWFAPVTEHSIYGLWLVAFLATVVTFLFSIWLCLLGSAFTQVIAAVSPAKKVRITRGEAARSRRARQGVRPSKR